MGGPAEDFEAMARDLEALTFELVDLLWPKPSRPAPA
jgi:hypothetical protein